jgi:DNA-binding transcriptional LysR family regulator
MDIRELNAFSVLAQELNFRKAAEVLGMSQPPLTRLIKNLEEKLGVSLFQRNTRSVELTGAGVYLLKRSQTLLDEIDRMEFEVRSLHTQKSNKIRISLSTSALHTNAPRIISSFKQQFPKIKVEVMEDPINSIRQLLRSGKRDIAFGVNEFSDPMIQSEAIQTHELGMLIPSENSLSKRKFLKLSDLAGETLIFHGKHDHLGFQKDFLHYVRSKNINVKVYYKRPNERCHNLVVLGKGLLISSKSLVKETSDVIYVPFADYTKRLKVFASWPSEHTSVALKAFVGFLEPGAIAPSSEMDGHLA